MPSLCSFSYAAFGLSFVYLVLFFLVIRYLLNLIQANSNKKRAQKIFLFVLIAQTLLRVIYFAMFPFSSSACEPTMRGNAQEHGETWWIHLLSNVPAVLFLMAFSVLVYTFARIYHKVLLAGVWFQERRFRFLTIVLVLLNILALIATFGDWAYAGSNQSSRLEAFVDMLLYCVLSISFILAGLFLAYGTLLYYQVQSIIRASSEHANGASTSSTYYSQQIHYGGQTSKNASRIGASAYAPYASSHNPNRYNQQPSQPASLLLPNALSIPVGGLSLPADATSGFTPVRKTRGDHNRGGEGEDNREGGEEEHGVYEPPTVAPGGINLSPGPKPTASSVGFGSSPKNSSGTQYTLSGFASPNLPIKGGSVHAHANNNNYVAHSYAASDEVSPSHSFSPEEVRAVAAAAEADLLSVVPIIGPDGQPLPPNPSSASEKEKLAPVPLAATGTNARQQQQQQQNGANNGNYNFASSVSPEYSQLPNSSRARSGRAMVSSPGGSTIAVMASTGTPTDQLVGSASYDGPMNVPNGAPIPVNGPPMAHTPKKGTSSLSRGSMYASGYGIRHSSSPPEDDDDDVLAGSDDTVERASSTRRVDHQSRGLANSSLLPNGYAYSDAGGHRGSSKLPAIDDDVSLGSSSGAFAPSNFTFTGNQPLLDSSTMSQSGTTCSNTPPNPMRKIAVIAAICTGCLLLRTLLLLVIVGLNEDFSWYTTLLYFTLSEILPLLAMLKVFNTPTPLVHVLGAGGGAF